MVCILDREALWQVFPTAANISPLTPAGYDWDLDGSPPDVVVELVCPPSAAPVRIETPEVSSYTPQWTGVNCTTTSDALLGEAISIRVTDVDVTFDDEVTSATYQVTSGDFETAVLVLQLPSQMGTLTLNLVRKQ
jgi:hypothetical protein